MKDKQARTDLERARGICTSLIRRIERLEMDKQITKNRISDLERQVESTRCLLQMVVADLKKANRKCCQETELC